MKKGIVLKLAMFVVAFAISTFAPSMTAAAASYDDEFAYSAESAHPFRRNGAPFRFKLSSAQIVN